MRTPVGRRATQVSGGEYCPHQDSNPRGREPVASESIMRRPRIPYSVSPVVNPGDSSPVAKLASPSAPNLTIGVGSGTLILPDRCVSPIPPRV